MRPPLAGVDRKDVIKPAAVARVLGANRGKTGDNHGQIRYTPNGAGAVSKLQHPRAVPAGTERPIA